MADFLEQLRSLLQAESVTQDSPPQVELVSELVFDDEPLEAILYGEPAAGPSPTSIFWPAQDAYARISDAEAGGNHCQALLLVEALRRDGHDLPATVRSALGPLLQKLLALPSLAHSATVDAAVQSLTAVAQRERDLELLVVLAFGNHARQRAAECRGLWQTIKELHAADLNLDDALCSVVTSAAVRQWDLDPSRFPTVVGLLSAAGFDAATDNSASSPEALPEVGFDRSALDGLRRLSARYRADDQMSFHGRLRALTIATAVTVQVADLKHPAVAACLNLLVRHIQDEGEHAAAVALGRRALAIRAEACGDDHPLVAQSLNNLGLSLVCLKEFTEGEEMLSRAVSIREDFPNPYYWLARLYRERAAADDRERERAAWRRYLNLGATSADRTREARNRLAELER